MALLWGDSGKITYGVQKTYTITFPSPFERLQTTPISLGTTAPGTATDSYTVQSSDLITISPGVYSYRKAGYMVIAGKNTNASATTVYWTIQKNGTNVVTGNQSIAANTFWNLQFYQLMDIAVGDTISLFLYGSATGVNYDYLSFYMMPTQVFPTKGPYFSNLSLTFSNVGTLTLGNPSVASTYSSAIYPYSSTSYMSVSAGTATFPLWGYPNNSATGNYMNSYGMVRSNFSDLSNTYYMLTDATYRPKYWKSSALSNISFREILR